MIDIVSFLKKGGIVIHNTDTCLGMAVDIMNEEAVELLYKVKRMERAKPVSILCSDLEMAEEYGVFSKKALKLAEKYLPGALTLIVPRTVKLPSWINPGLNNCCASRSLLRKASCTPCVGIRIPADEFSLEMVRILGNPVTTTSCNVSGELVCLSDAQVRGVFGEYMDSGDLMVAFEGQSTTKVSTIIKVEGDLVEIVRKGEQVLEEV